MLYSLSYSTLFIAQIKIEIVFLKNIDRRQSRHIIKLWNAMVNYYTRGNNVNNIMYL